MRPREGGGGGLKTALFVLFLGTRDTCYFYGNEKGGFRV